MTADIEALTEILLYEFGTATLDTTKVNSAMAAMLPRTLRIVAELEERGFIIIAKPRETA